MNANLPQIYFTDKMQIIIYNKSLLFLTQLLSSKVNTEVHSQCKQNNINNLLSFFL